MNLILAFVFAALAVAGSARYVFELWVYLTDKEHFGARVRWPKVTYDDGGDRKVSAVDRLLFSYPLLIALSSIFAAGLFFA